MLEKIEEIKDTLLKYLETRVELVKTETQEKVEKAVVQLVYLFILLILVFSLFLFLLLVLTEFLNEWLESHYLGYVIVFGLLLLKTLGWLWLREPIERFLRKIFYKIFNHT